MNYLFLMHLKYPEECVRVLPFLAHKPVLGGHIACQMAEAMVMDASGSHAGDGVSVLMLTIIRNSCQNVQL